MKRNPCCKCGEISAGVLIIDQNHEFCSLRCYNLWREDLREKAQKLLNSRPYSYGGNNASSSL